ncbi:MAG: hypothetical protein QNJ40_06045 [Xanthomonadales bacterium]|nr:hypothetical protein [Xanthomonadales bacterium]
MQAVRNSGLPSTDYYAPDFRVEVEGQELDPESQGDVLELKVSMDMENMASFDMTINNWDDKTVAFKYSDGDLFDVGNRVHVMMGYAGNLLSMVSGEISSVTPKFPETGPSSLTVGGLDGLFKLRDKKAADGDITKFTKMADWQIAEYIAQINGLKSKVTREGQVHNEVVLKNQDYATFLMERAKRIDFDCFVLTDPDSGEATLHFVKPSDGRDSSRIRVYQFRWGESLINFMPTINLSRQVAKVTVRGWDDRTKQAIVATAGPEDLPGAGKSSGGKSGPEAAAANPSSKKEVVVDAPVNSEQEAKDLAVSLLTERAYEFITGTGTVIGLPDLRHGDNIELLGIGKRFDGTYYVKKVDHMINNSGYKTQFEVRRIYDGGTKK